MGLLNIVCFDSKLFCVEDPEGQCLREKQRQTEFNLVGWACQEKFAAKRE